MFFGDPWLIRSFVRHVKTSFGMNVTNLPQHEKVGIISRYVWQYALKVCFTEFVGSDIMSYGGAASLIIKHEIESPVRAFNNNASDKY